MRARAPSTPQSGFRFVNAESFNLLIIPCHLPRGAKARHSVFAQYAAENHSIRESSLPIVQQEVFGPVLTMQVFDTEAEAVSLANDSEYGLAATVWSRDVDRPLRVARVLQAGTVHEFEEGGFKQSGRGRLRGQAGLDDFLECKHIAFKPGTIKR